MEKKVKIEELDPIKYGPLKGYFEGYRFYGPSSDTGYLMPAGYKELADNVLNMTARPDDVWVTGYPRSGTTLTQELVWQVANGCDYEKASKSPLMETIYVFRTYLYVYFRGEMSVNLIQSRVNGEVSEPVYTMDAVNEAPSPRFIKTHFPFSLLPSNLLDTTKVVYIARDPRDVVVSLYQFARRLMTIKTDFKTFWTLFFNDLVIYSPCLAHVKEAWQLRHHPNMEFIFYEDMIRDIPLYIKRVADFLDKKLTDDQIAELTEHLNIKNFRKNESVNPNWMNKSGNPDSEGFIRKGEAGGWREHFDEEMAAQAQRWISEHLAGSDLRFPDHTSQ
ncbi:luciferin sulfotransferase-like [Leguminivora glycinivorella]|uniref:luciferin sulfotransferase-like n=1 Tax=Leguminivora glycinivorella TaxID=1035111 RepID=UPI00200D6D58|nr:luciferin sulfotransferase-like [Leguminivora glycinivorella]